MSIHRVALIYDNTLRPETTGVYCLRALQELVEVEHFLAQDIDRIPRTGFDLYLNIDDGLRYHLPAELRPSAWWAIDTHMDPAWAEEKGRDFDWLFAAQRDGAERLCQAGLRAAWLPLACDPAIHQPHPLAKRWDVCFVGRTSAGPRVDLLRLVRQHFPNTFIGERYFDEFAKTYSESRIGFNRSVKNDVNMRVFETLGCGTLLVTNDLHDNGQHELFESDRHLVTYQGRDELVDKLWFYLSHEEARQKIALAGHAEAVANHTYRHRMQAILETIERKASVAAPSTGVAVPATVETKPPPADWLDTVDFIVKTFLRPQALLRSLRSILEYYPSAHVTIADDGNLRESSDPDSRACRDLIDRNDRFVLHSLAYAAGVTAGRNLLVDKTHRPFLLLLDDDFCFTAETRIERFWERLKSDPEVGLVAGACIDVVENERRPRNSGGTLEIQGDTLVIDTAGWRNRAAGLRDYVPQFALIRREVFDDVHWEGGIGGEHYDFCLQLQKSRWKVAHDVSVLVGHYHFTPALPGYAERRFDCAAAQQWLLRKWNLQRIVQDGKTIIERDDFVDTGDASAHQHNGQPLSAIERVKLSADAPAFAVNGAGDSRRNGHAPAPLSMRMLPNKDASYFEHARPEVVALIPPTARRVLDLGCGTGRLGALLKERQPAEVVGVELQPDAAADARERLNQVLQQSAEDPALEFPDGRFDCIVCADILEHLREPEQVLAKSRRWLTPDGVLVASLPNVRHHSVVASLLEGNWTYESAGLLDSDHVRFFTRREIEKLFYRQGFEIRAMHAKPGPGHDEWQQAGRPGNVRVGSLNLAGLSPEDAEEFFTYQYLVVASRSMDVPARASQFSPPSQGGAGGVALHTVEPVGAGWRAWPLASVDPACRAESGAQIDALLPGPSRQEGPTADATVAANGWHAQSEAMGVGAVQLAHDKACPPAAGLTSIIIVTYNQLAYTKECIDSIRVRTDEPYELIFVDNGSTDGTVGYLQSVCGQVDPACRAGSGAQIDAPRPSPSRQEGPTADANVAGAGCHAQSEAMGVGDGQLAPAEACTPTGALQNAQLIENAENRGFPAAANQGLAVATGEYALLLNNDTVVTTGWLRRMRDVFENDPHVGLVGPCSNNVSGGQMVPVTYQNLASLDGFAWDWGKRHRGVVEETDRLIGFCLAIRRAVIDQIGLLDEQFGIGCFEDDDLCLRSLHAGWKAVIARASFVHHYGNRTFQGNGVDLGALLQTNREKFQQKWSEKSTGERVKGGAEVETVEGVEQSKRNAANDEIRMSNEIRNPQSEIQNHASPCLPVPPSPCLAPAPRFALERAPTGGLLLVPQPRLSLCMIVRDNETTIGPCLESIRPYVDEIVVVDTGSKDRTPEICRNYGAQLFEFPWCDDFSAARNESLRHAGGEWLFWMDSDDTISPECGRKLRTLADGPHPENVFGYIMRVHCPGPDNQGHRDVTVVDHAKLIRNRPDLRFEGRIHEQLLPAIRRAGGVVVWTDIHVLHSGSDPSPEGKQRKLERDLRILNRELAERPNHPFVLFNLGMTYADVKRYGEAVDCLQRCLAVSKPEESHLRKAYALLVISLQQSNRNEEAWEHCQQGLALYSDDKELLFHCAMLHHRFGRLKEAEQIYLRVLNNPEEWHFTSIDQDLAGYKARHNLALVYEEMGDLRRAEGEWRRIVGDKPGYPSGWKGLAHCLLTQGRLEEVRQVAERLQADSTLAATGFLVAAQLCLATAAPDQARRELEKAEASAPHDPDVLREQCRFLFENVDPALAVDRLEILAGLAPDDPSVHHNRAVAYLRVGRVAEAVGACRRSITLRPDSGSTHILLAQAEKAAAESGHSVADFRIQTLVPDSSKFSAVPAGAAGFGVLPSPYQRLPLETSA